MEGPKFACQEQLIPGESYREKYEFCIANGFSGIEIWSDNLVKNFSELAYLHASSGLCVSSGCQSFEGGLIDSNEEARQSAIRSTVEALHALSELGGRGYVLPAGFALGSLVLPPYRPPRSAEDDTLALIDALEKILPAAEKLGVRIFLEPINRYETHFLHTLNEAQAIVEKIDHPYLRITADFFHMSMEEANPAEALLHSGKWIDHIHLADSNRKLPGQGHLDFVQSFSSLQKIGFEGWMAIECDGPTNAEESLPLASKFLHESWRKANDTNNRP